MSNSPTIPSFTDLAEKAYSSIKTNLLPGLDSRSPMHQRLDAEAAQRDQVRAQAKAAVAQKQKNQFSILSLKDLGSHSAQDSGHIAAYTKAYQSADVNNQPTRELKAAALKGYLNRVFTSNEFQTLDGPNRELVTRELYRKWVVPALSDQGVVAPSYNDWILGVPKTKPEGTAKGTFVGSLSEGLGKDVTLAANTIRTLFGTVAPKMNARAKSNTVAARGFATNLDKVSADLEKINTDYTSNFNTGDTKAQWAANMAGQALAYAPVYLTMEALGGAAIGEVGAEAIGAESGGSQLTGKLLTLAQRAGYGGKGSQTALRALIDSTEFYGSDKGEGLSTKLAVQDAASVAILGPALSGILHSTEPLGTLVTRTLKLGAGKQAVAGEGLIHSVEASLEKEGLGGSEFDKIPKPTEKIYSLVHDDDPHFIAAKQAEMKLREQWASHFFPEVADKYPGRAWNNIAKTKRARIISYISELQKSGAELQPVLHPEVQYEANKYDLENLLKSDPQAQAKIKAVLGNSGLDPAAVLTKSQAEDVVNKYKLNTKTKQLAAAFKSDEFEPLEGASASLGANYKVSYPRNPKAPEGLLINPTVNIEDFLSGTTRYLEKNPNTPSGRIYYESPKMHLLAVAFDSNAPQPVKNNALRFLKKEFDLPKAKAEYQAGWLKYHVEKLRDAGHLENRGQWPGHVYRSTKLVVPRYGTSVQKMVTPEVATEFQHGVPASLRKNNPTLARALDKVYSQMITFADKANKSDKAVDRLNSMRNIHNEIQELR